MLSINSIFFVSKLEKLKFNGLILITALTGCGSSEIQTMTPSNEIPLDTPVSEQDVNESEVNPIVQLNKNSDGHYRFFVNDKEFDLKGVGMIGGQENNKYAHLKSIGGNAFRTWQAEWAQIELEQAKENDQMVALGIALGKEIEGFDCDNASAVATQFERVKTIVSANKNHPNLLCWVLGNEINLLFNEQGELTSINPSAYKALNDIVTYIHAEDPNHPVTIPFAGVPIDDIQAALRYIPSLDFISIQVYGDLSKIPQMIESVGIDKPYLLTEFGPIGHWEAPKTHWQREIEAPSAIKATQFADAMQEGIRMDHTGLLIGGFAFAWGQKQERTPTWYGLLDVNENATPRVDELIRFWQGSYPTYRAPQVSAITLNGLSPNESVVLTPDQSVTASVEVYSLDGEPINFQWVLMNEVDEPSLAGAPEVIPDTLPLIIEQENISDTNVAIQFKTPATNGEYRLFLYARNGHKKVGYANFPFMVLR